MRLNFTRRRIRPRHRKSKKHRLVRKQGHTRTTLEASLCLEMERNISSNFSSEVSATNVSKRDLRCSHFSELFFDIGNFSTPYLVNFALNIPLSVIGILGNLLVLLAIRKITSLHMPSRVLLGNLVLTDLCVGAIVQPSYMAYLFTKVNSGFSSLSCWSAIVSNIFASTLACCSFMTLTAISLDRQIALYYHVKYRTIVTTKRVLLVIAMIWLVSVLWGTSWQWCFACHYPICIAIMSICMPLSTFAYVKIYLGLRQRQKQRRNQLGPQHHGSSSSLAKYRSTAISMVIVYVLLLLCYTPYLCLVLLVELDGLTIFRLRILEYASSLTFFNSAFNPVVYCWRIREVRAFCLRTARKVFCVRRAEIHEGSANVIPTRNSLAWPRSRNAAQVAAVESTAIVSTRCNQESIQEDGDVLSTVHLSH